MGLSLVTGPTSEPVTLGEVKDHLSFDGAEKDGLIAGYVLAARREIETLTNRALMTQTWDYTINRGWPMKAADGCWRQRIELPLAPVQSVTSVTYVDESGTTQTLGTSQYVLGTDGELGVIFPAYGVEWPTTRDQPAAVSVRFVAGYAQPPDELRVAIMLRVEQLLDRDPSQKSALDDAWRAMVDQYVIRRVL